jgi:hypothetical protein
MLVGISAHRICTFEIFHISEGFVTSNNLEFTKENQILDMFEQFQVA